MSKSAADANAAGANPVEANAAPRGAMGLSRPLEKPERHEEGSQYDIRTSGGIGKPQDPCGNAARDNARCSDKWVPAGNRHR